MDDRVAGCQRKRATTWEPGLLLVLPTYLDPKNSATQEWVFGTDDRPDPVHLTTSSNAYAERYVRSAREECLSRIVPFGEEGLGRALKEFLTHYHEERNHQGKDNVLLFPSAKRPALSKGDAIGCKQRLGGLLKYYYRDAA